MRRIRQEASFNRLLARTCRGSAIGAVFVRRGEMKPAKEQMRSVSMLTLDLLRGMLVSEL